MSDFAPQDAAWLQRLAATREWTADLDVDALVFGLLENFGSTDPVFRDDLSYSLMARAVESGRLSPAAVRTLIRTAVDDDHLFYGIGPPTSPTVFQRTFSVLVVPLVLEDRAARDALSQDDVRAVQDAVIRYTYAEQDRRGYVDGQGWAHSAAHTADALGALGLDPAATDLEPVLLALHHLATLPDPLTFLEDDRIAWAVCGLVTAGRVIPGMLQGWLDRFQRPAEDVDTRVGTISGSNAEHVLRSLYFRLLQVDRAHAWLEPVFDAAVRFDLFYQPDR
jgi:hypothetical protein